jgi:hypothetical protein
MRNQNPLGRLGLHLWGARFSKKLHGRSFGSPVGSTRIGTARRMGLGLMACLGLLGPLGIGSCPSLADGPADNQVATIRPVPPPGIEVPAEVRESLTKSLEVLKKSIEELSASKAARVVQPTLLCENVDDSPIENLDVSPIGPFQNAIGQVSKTYVKRYQFHCIVWSRVFKSSS